MRLRIGLEDHDCVCCRLEKLCPPDNSKVRMSMEESVASFQLNSSLVPGNVFNCHLELYLDKSDSGKRDEMDSERWEGGQINANHLGLLLHHVMARIIISLYVTLVAIALLVLAPQN